MNSAAGLIRPEHLAMSAEQWAALGPLFWVFGGVISGMLLAVVRGLPTKWMVAGASMLALVGAGRSGLGLLGADGSVRIELFNRMMVVDGFTLFFGLVFVAAALVTIGVSVRYLDHEKLQYPEYYVLVMLATFGMIVMTSAQELIVLFLGLEILSLAVYVLVGFRRADRRGNEASIKYFILGGVASAIYLYGAALLYGTAQSLHLADIASYAARVRFADAPLFVVGAWLVVVGFMFKVAAAPFHMWMPDVYEGAPVTVTGFMTTGLKAAAFAAFARVFVAFGKPFASLEQVHDLIWWSAVATMVIGNFVALTQSSLKRMLAYSSIAHTGYLMIGFLVSGGEGAGFAPVVLYLVSYVAMNLGVFAILSSMAGRDDLGLSLHDLAGMGERRPLLSAAMAVFMFSMAGIPPTAGFVAKYWLFSQAVGAGEVPLVIIAVLCSAVSVYYYLRVLVYMYMREPVGAAPGTRVSGWVTASVACLLVLTIQVGVAPGRLMEAAKRAVSRLT